MGFFDFLTVIFHWLAGYGAIGILAASGWGLVVWHLYGKNKSRDAWIKAIEAKDGIITKKDEEIDEAKDKLATTISEVSNQRISDLKEMSEEMQDLYHKTINTLDKLTLALNVHEYTKNDDLRN